MGILGFGVEGSVQGFRVKGFRIQDVGFGFGVHGPGIRLYCLGFRFRGCTRGSPYLLGCWRLPHN